MTTETKHTPTQYSMIDSGFGRFQIIRHIPGTERIENIANDLSHNRADEIVRACNSHDALVELIKGAILAAGQGENVKHMLVDGLAAVDVKVGA